MTGWGKKSSWERFSFLRQHTSISACFFLPYCCGWESAITFFTCGAGVVSKEYWFYVPRYHLKPAINWSIVKQNDWTCTYDLCHAICKCTWMATA